MQYEIRMKLKIGSRRGREGESWDSKELICFPPSFLLLCLSAFLLRGLVCFFTALLPLSYLKCHIMGQHSAVIGGDKKPGRSHSDQQPQQHTVWGTTLACAAENNLGCTLHSTRSQESISRSTCASSCTLSPYSQYFFHRVTLTLSPC